VSGSRVRVRADGQITIPRRIRARLGVEEGDTFDVETTEEGFLLLRPTKTIPASQAWFWTSGRQAMEREASESIAAGRTTVYKTHEDFLAALREWDAAAEADADV
jgi:AbrB family looped-hinge helix DNA binding protein